MDNEEARRLVEAEGFRVIGLQEEKDDVFIFICDDDGAVIEVAVINGSVIVAPT